MCTLFWQNHSFFSALEVFNNLGRFLLSKADVSNSDFEDIAFRHFDASFYQQNYAELDSLIREESFRHYLLTGCRMGLSPNSKFDERFYLSFYDDVRLAVESGLLVCGFHHFLIAGRREGRLQKHSLSATLEARWRGVTAPVGVDHLSEFARKFQPPKAVAEPRSKKRLTVLLPDLNPDIFFGGYKAVIELIRLLVENGVDVRVVKMDSSYDGAHYFAFHNKGTELEHLFKDVVVQGKDAELAVAESDSFLAYSVWDAHCVAQLTKMTSDRRFIFLIQEYESIFFSNNSHKVLVEAAYDLPHYPVFNSRLLVKYFAHNKLGIFRGPSPAAGKFSVFEHVLPEPRQSRRSSNGPFTFFVYTRPEAHAGRNLFELCVMALRQAIDDYQPSSSWRFIGLVD